MKDTTNLKIALAASLTKTILWSNVKAKQRMMKFSYLNWQPWSTLSIKINIDPLVECEGRCHHFLLLISKRTSKWQKPWKGKVPSTMFQLCCSCQNGQQCTLGHMHNAISVMAQKSTPAVRKAKQENRAKHQKWHWTILSTLKRSYNLALQEILCFKNKSTLQNTPSVESIFAQRLPSSKLVTSSASAFTSPCSSRVALQ